MVSLGVTIEDLRNEITESSKPCPMKDYRIGTLSRTLLFNLIDDYSRLDQQTFETCGDLLLQSVSMVSDKEYKLSQRGRLGCLVKIGLEHSPTLRIPYRYLSYLALVDKF